jgi:hypothetical protein
MIASLTRHFVSSASSTIAGNKLWDNCLIPMTYKTVQTINRRIYVSAIFLKSFYLSVAIVASFAAFYDFLGIFCSVNFPLFLLFTQFKACILRISLFLYLISFLVNLILKHTTDLHPFH